MVRIDKNTGNLIIEIETDDRCEAAEELQIRREALYDMITEHNTATFFRNDIFYGIVKLLQDTEPTFEQWKQILKTDSVHSD